MDLVIFGAPGSGKGTQSELLAEKFPIKHVSTGNMLRDSAKSGSVVGRKVKAIIDAGDMVSDELIMSLISGVISENSRNVKSFMFDGIPRNFEQANLLSEVLMKHDRGVACVVNLVISEDDIVNRLTNRLTCGNCSSVFNNLLLDSSVKEGDTCSSCNVGKLARRADDNEEIIRKRYQKYLLNLNPILDYYDEMRVDVKEIVANRDVKIIFNEISEFLSIIFS